MSKIAAKYRTIVFAPPTVSDYITTVIALGWSCMQLDQRRARTRPFNVDLRPF
jgi:hypothetical protein